MLNISKGKIPHAQRVVIYGPEGIGKTTLAAQTPDPLIIDLEHGSGTYDVQRINDVNDWSTLLATIEEVAMTPGVCKTLVIDTADKAEMLCTEFVLAKAKKDSIEAFGYGKGQTYLVEEYVKMLAALDKCVKAGIHVVVLAHAALRKVELPEEQGAYDHWEMKLAKKDAPIVKEWADALLFLNYKVYVTGGDNPMEKGKASGGERYVHTQHTPYWDAKNRHGLPADAKMDYAAIKPIFAFAEDTEKPLDKLLRLMAESNVTAEEVQAVISAKGNAAPDTPVTEYSEELITKFCLPYWAKIVQMIEADPNRSPF